MSIKESNKSLEYSLEAPYYIPDVKWTSRYNYEFEDKSKKPAHVDIYDVTLRDGDQTPGVVFLEDERVRIADTLAEMKVPRIEAGMPPVSKAVENAMRRMVARKYPHTKIYGFSRALLSDVELVVDIGCDGIIIEYTANPYIVKYAYQKTADELIESLIGSINYAKSKGLDVAFMGWDWFRAPLEWTKWVVGELYEKTQLDGLVLVDTFGCATPDAVEEMFRLFKGWFPRLRLEFHGHNDIGCGNANCLAAVRGGAEVVHTAMNGLGDRCGNVPTEEMAVLFEMHKGIDTGMDLTKIASACKLLSTISKVPIHDNKPVVGARPYYAESGVLMDVAYKLSHNDGLRVTNFDISVAPSVIGRNDNVQFVLGKSSGRNSIRLFLDKYGLTATDEQTKEILDMVVNESLVTKSLVPEEMFLHFVDIVKSR